MTSFRKSTKDILGTHSTLSQGHIFVACLHFVNAQYHLGCCFFHRLALRNEKFSVLKWTLCRIDLESMEAKSRQSNLSILDNRQRLQLGRSIESEAVNPCSQRSEIDVHFSIGERNCSANHLTMVTIQRAGKFLGRGIIPFDMENPGSRIWKCLNSR